MTEVNSGSDQLVAVIRSIFGRLAEHERRIAGMNTPGKVVSVDHGAHKARFSIGKDVDGNDVLTPWLAYGQTAGALKIHNPPTVGQTMVLRSANGDIEQAVAEPLFWSDENPAISDDGSIRKIAFGDVAITLSSGGIEVSVAGTVFSFSGDGYAQEGGTVEHNTKNIGGDHKHSGVVPGGGNSGPPV